MKQKEETSQRAASSTTTDSGRPTHDKGKRKFVDNAAAEQSCKFKENSLVLKATLEIEAKRRHHNRRIALRQRENERMEETKKELQELKRQLREEHELQKREGSEEG